MSRRYVSFILGPGRYCLPVDQVLQIVRPEGILQVPKAPPFVTGVINLRSDIIPVVSLRSRLGIGDTEGNRPGAGGAEAGPGSKARIIVARVGTRSYGLAVDEVREIIDIDEAGIRREATEAFGVHAEFVQGVAQREEKLFLILDLARVLSAGRDLQGAEPV